MAARRAALAESAAAAIAAGEVIEAVEPEVAPQDNGVVEAALASLARAETEHRHAIERRNACIVERDGAGLQVLLELCGELVEHELLGAVRHVRTLEADLQGCVDWLRQRGQPG